MSEIISALKSFGFAVLIMLGMQIKVGNATLETRAEEFFQASAISMYLQSVSSGAVLMIQNTTKRATEFFAKKMGRTQEPQKASRLNFELKRPAQQTERD